MVEGTTRRAPARVAPLLVAAGLGLPSGAFGAYCYYDPVLRPPAHSFALWLLVLVLVARTHDRHQITRAALLVVPAAIVALVVVVLPDVIEQLLFAGGYR